MSMVQPDEIERLIARVALGERSAFDALYGHTSAKLFGVALRVLEDRTEAEEALQDTYVKLWHNAARYRQNGFSPMTWLITIARNTAIDRKRKQLRQAETGEIPADILADPASGPETLVMQASDRASLAACLAELEEARAEAVQRAYLDGDTYAALAERFGVPVNTMRTWLRRSLLKLRECLSR